jgi:hypothetical protein
LKKFINIILFASCLLLVACHEKKPIVDEPVRIFAGFHPIMDELIRTKDGVFRGLDLNDSLSKIKRLELADPLEADENHVYYEYKIDSTQLVYSLDYALVNDTLEEINVQINCQDVELCNYLFCDLKDYYANKLPNPIEAKGSIVYNCFEGQRKPFVISLSDNSTPTKGIINMVIYKDK